MPRSFLIKKHFGAGAAKMKRSLCESKEDRRSIDHDDQHSCCSSSSSSDEKKYRHEHYIPVDLTPPRTPSAGLVTTPPPAVALIAARPSAPTDEHKSRPPSFALLEPLNLNVACAAATSWPKSVIPPYLPFSFPSLYPAFPQVSSAADFYGPLYPLSLPQRTATLPAEQLSPFAARGEYASPPAKKAEPLAPLPVDAVKNNSNANVDISSYLYEMWSSENKSDCGINGGSREGGTPPTASSGGEGSSVGSADMSEAMLLKKRPSSREAPRYQCSDCSKSYSTFSGLSKHQQFHCVTQAKKSFGCKFCEKIYVSLGALKMHIRTHTLPCKCKLCGKAFSRPWLLQGHIRTHTGEKPFACPHCNRAFADRSNLRAHLQTHSDVKKYSCKNCSKTFSRMSLLLKHEDGGCPGTQH